MIIACATNDGNKFVSCHFGDAEQYYIYELNEGNCNLLKIINNTTEEEEGVHADPKKASGIVNILKGSNVQVVMTTVFGPNIKRIVKHFVPVISANDEIKKGLEDLISNYFRLNEVIMENSGDIYFNFKNNSENKI